MNVLGAGDLEAQAPAPPAGIDPELARRAAELAPGAAAPPVPAGASADRPAGAPIGQPPAAPPIDYAGDAKLLIEFVHDGVTPVYPTLGPIYTPEVRERLAGSLGRLMEKYQLSLAAIFAKWEPEIRFTMVALPLVAPTVLAIREQRAADRVARAAAKLRDQQKQANPNAASPST